MPMFISRWRFLSLFLIGASLAVLIKVDETRLEKVIYVCASIRIEIIMNQMMVFFILLIIQLFIFSVTEYYLRFEVKPLGVL